MQFSQSFPKLSVFSLFRICLSKTCLSKVFLSKTYLLRLLLVKALVFSGCVLLASSLLVANFALAASTTTEEKLDASQIPLEEIRNFAEVFQQIKEAYVHPVEDKQLMVAAIKGMLADLDPHSAYLEAEAMQDLRESSDGEFGGLGIEISKEDGNLVIITPLDDTPAAKAGLQPQDIILQIDKQPTRSMPLNKATELMRGQAGTEIELTIQRGQAQPFTVKLERASIKIASISQELLAADLGYVRISQFQMNTGAQLRKALTQLEEENSAALEGLILDLRNNPGGVLQAAADVADAFLDTGKIVYTQGRVADSQMRFDANPGDLLKGAPLIVLINGGSASASEIVAGALQDHKRALIMGTPSFGKGSVQSVLPLSETTGIKLTTALYYTPLDRSIQAEGIQPDILVQQASIRPVEEPSFTKEADLDGHLNNAKSKSSQQKSSQTESLAQKKPRQDYQLNEATNLLRGLVLFK